MANIERPSPIAVSDALERVLSSEAFSRSERLRAFLKYVVETEQAGIAHQLKGYTIGIDVFDRSPAFNADSDPLVRVHAGKLRKLLATYYAGDGRHDEWRIEIPKGAYVPVYRRQKALASLREQTAEKSTPRRRFSWLPAPLSSPRAVFSMLPLLIFIPLSSLAMNVELPSQSRLHGAVFERKFGTDLPRLAIRSDLPRTGDAGKFAEALRQAASHYQTLSAAPASVLWQGESAGAKDALGFTIAVSEQAEPSGLKITVSHDASLELLYDGFIAKADLDNDADMLFESLAVASKILASDGHIFRFAENAGLSNALMNCMTTTDAYRHEQTRETFAAARECQQRLSAEHRRKLDFVISASAIPKTLMR